MVSETLMHCQQFEERLSEDVIIIDSIERKNFSSSFAKAGGTTSEVANIDQSASSMESSVKESSKMHEDL